MPLFIMTYHETVWDGNSCLANQLFYKRELLWSSLLTARRFVHL